jgi:hypothetical protein
MRQGYFNIKDRLELQVQDVATSDDPLLQALERKGYSQNRIKILQDNISAKNTIDMFTGQTQPLTEAEKLFQRDCDKALKAISGR